jgi:hypothetical protein
VTAKSLGIQAASTSLRTTEARDPLTITCTGTAKDNNSLLKVLDKMRSTKGSGIRNVQLVGITGTAPQLRFTIKLGFGGPAQTSPNASPNARPTSK